MMVTEYPASVRARADVSPMIPEPIMPTSIVNALSNLFQKRFAVLGEHPTDWGIGGINLRKTCPSITRFHVTQAGAGSGDQSVASLLQVEMLEQPTTAGRHI
jgi:hypothetical protein